MKSQEVKHSLLNVSNDAKSLSILMRPSDLSTTGSLLGDEEFEFDDIIINSAAYRRVFKKQQNKSQVSAIEIRSQDVVSRVEKNRRNPWQILGRASRLASYIQVEAPASPLSSSAPRRSQSNVQPTVAPNKVTDLYTTNGQYIEGRVAEGLHEINIGMGGYVSAFRLSATFEPTRDPKARSWHTFRYKDYYSEGFIRTIDGGKDNQVSSLWDWSCTGRRQDDINRGDMIAVTALFTNGWALGRQLRFDANTWPGTGIMGRQPGLKLFPLSCVCLPQHWSRLAQLSPNDLATELTSWMEKRKEGRTVGWIKI